MWKESHDTVKGEKPPALRTGLTTGSCATACSVAAAYALLSALFTSHSTNGASAEPLSDAPLSGRSLSDTPLSDRASSKQPSSVSITLPQKKSRGDLKHSKTDAKQVDLAIVSYETLGPSCIRTSTIKDAGDDPDITHGATVFVELQLSDTQGIQFNAASGVGTVTKAGLLLPVGEPAINPVPRQMICDNLRYISKLYGYKKGFIVAIGVENGENLALKTMNPRLGIVGGLSILGTTGIVRPFSCAAWIASIYQGIDVADSNACSHIAASTGNSSEATIQQRYQLDDMALIEMGDFAGAVLKHLKKIATDRPLTIKKLSICGGFGKISKLAQGHMDLNSRASAIDFDFIAEVAKSAKAVKNSSDENNVGGFDDGLHQKILHSNTSIEALQHCDDHHVDLAGALCQKAWEVATNIVPQHIEVEVFTINRKGEIVGEFIV